METATNNKFNFLDLTPMRNNNYIDTSWYTKRIHSGIYFNFYSEHPISLKIRTVTGLTDRIMELTSPHLR